MSNQHPSEQKQSTLVEPTIATRLHYSWACLWTGIWSLALAPISFFAIWLSPKKAFHTWASLWAKGLLLGIGVRRRVVGIEKLKHDQPVIFVSNHQNSLDVLTTLAGLPRPFGFLAKAELRTMPIIGWWLRASPSVFVDKSTPKRARASLSEAAQQIREGRSILIFAEGERSWSNGLLPFKRGAFALAIEAQVPIQPVVLKRNIDRLDERRWASWPGRCDLVILDAVYPTDGVGQDVAMLKERVRNQIDDELNPSSVSFLTVE